MNIFLALMISCFISLATAAPIHCVTNAKQIAVGDTSKEVRGTCGKPDDTVTDTITKTTSHPVTHWYYLVQFVDQLAEDQTYPDSALIKVAIEFYQNEVDHINVLVPLGTTEDHAAFNMLGYLISKGMNKQQVQLLLGQPTTISQDTVTENNAIEITSAFIYHDSDTNQQQTLHFDNNKLISSTEMAASDTESNVAP